MSKQSSITAFCVKGLVPTRQPPTKKRRAEPLPKRRPGRPRKRPCLQVAQEPANVHHDLSDAMKMVDDYHHELEKYFSRLYLDSLESGADGRAPYKKTASNLQQRASLVPRPSPDLSMLHAVVLRVTLKKLGVAWVRG